MFLGSDRYIVRLKREDAPEGGSEELLERTLELSEQNQYRQTLGRRHGREERVNNGFFESPCVSSKHGEVFVRDGQVWYKDTGSRNKSKVNGVILQAEEPVVLPQNSTLVLADTKKNVTLYVSYEKLCLVDKSPIHEVVDIEDEAEDEELIHHLAHRATKTGSSSSEEDAEDTMHNSQSSSFFSNVAQSSSIDSPLNNVATVPSICPPEDEEEEDYEEENYDEEDEEEDEEEEEEEFAIAGFVPRPAVELQARAEEKQAQMEAAAPQPTLEFAPEESEPESELEAPVDGSKVLDNVTTRPEPVVIKTAKEEATTTSNLGKRKREEDDEPFEREERRGPPTEEEQPYDVTVARPSKARQLFHDALMITTGVVLGGAGTIAALLYTE